MLAVGFGWTRAVGSLAHSKSTDAAASGGGGDVKSKGDGFELADYCVELTADAALMAVAFKRNLYVLSAASAATPTATKRPATIGGGGATPSASDRVSFDCDETDEIVCLSWLEFESPLAATTGSGAGPTAAAAKRPATTAAAPTTPPPFRVLLVGFSSGIIRCFDSVRCTLSLSCLVRSALFTVRRVLTVR